MLQLDYFKIKLNKMIEKFQIFEKMKDFEKIKLTQFICKQILKLAETVQRVQLIYHHKPDLKCVII